MTKGKFQPNRVMSKIKVTPAKNTKRKLIKKGRA